MESPSPLTPYPSAPSSSLSSSLDLVARRPVPPPPLPTSLSSTRSLPLLPPHPSSLSLPPLSSSLSLPSLSSPLSFSSPSMEGVTEDEVRAIPSVSWKRRLNATFDPHSEFQVAMVEGLRLAGLGYRLYKYILSEVNEGRLPMMNPFKKSPAGPRFGVPMGGIGGGTINRGWRGDFGRWSILPGFPNYSIVDADAFSVYVAPRGGAGIGRASVMSTSTPSSNKAIQRSWEYLLTGWKSHYYALFPRAWTHYIGEPDPDVNLVCRQVTPFIPHNYRESSFPVCVFEWEIENTDSVTRDVSIMLTWQNGTGDSNDFAGRHTNSLFVTPESGKNIYGIRMRHVGLSTEGVIQEVRADLDKVNAKGLKEGAVKGGKMLKKGGKKVLNEGKRILEKRSGGGTPLRYTYSSRDRSESRPGLPNTRRPSTNADKLTFAIAVEADADMSVTYNTRFFTHDEGACGRLWGSFNTRGEVRETEGGGVEESPIGQAIGAALCVKVSVPPLSKRRVPFAIAWDHPIVRFFSGRGYFRRYTKFFGNTGECDAAQRLCIHALAQYKEWERDIYKWQYSILRDTDLPNEFRHALFNELYYITEGGSVWTAGEANDPSLLSPSPLSPPLSLESEDFDTIGKFGYLESMEYLMVNTYDVHFYASWALALLFPLLELSLQCDFGSSTLEEYRDVWKTLHSGEQAKRKVRGAVPHDLGNPGDDPWYQVNAYNIQPINDWKDLNSKFVLQIYRDYTLTRNARFLAANFVALQECMERLDKFDRDGDGMIENDGFPDQTYDTWAATGVSAYSGGLYVAALSAMREICRVLLIDDESVRKFSERHARAQNAYISALWNGRYYDYDTSSNEQHDSVMADMMCGQWYARACGLPSVDPCEANIRSALKTIYALNVMGYKNGTLGAVNGTRPDGRVDRTCLQSVEVWTGTTYGLAACMVQEGMEREGFATAKGIIRTTYEAVGYHFQTPEAWDSEKHYRALGYMRPLAIWGIYYAWAKRNANRKANSDHSSQANLGAPSPSLYPSPSPSSSPSVPSHHRDAPPIPLKHAIGKGPQNSTFRSAPSLPPVHSPTNIHSLPSPSPSLSPSPSPLSSSSPSLYDTKSHRPAPRPPPSSAPLNRDEGTMRS